MKIRVEVTGEDIATGVPEDSTHCALALATKRAIGNPKFGGYYSSVYVNEGDIYIYVAEAGRYATANSKVIPPRLKRFIRRFDDRKPVKPMRLTFHIRGVEERDPCPGPAS